MLILTSSFHDANTLLEDGYFDKRHVSRILPFDRNQYKAQATHYPAL